MKKNNIFKYLAILSVLLIGFASCEKTKDADPIGDRGQTVVKLVNGGTPGHILKGIDFVTTSQSIDIADVRRDVPNTAEMNRTMNIVIKDDTAALRQYNIDEGTDLQIMPSSWYTLNIPRSGPGGTYSITLAPGELAKQITITIPNATLLDPGETYGFPFTIVSADANGNISEAKTIVYEIAAKNDYDGVYSGKGYGFLGGNTVAPHLFSWDCDFDINLITVAGDKVVMDAQPLYRGTPPTTTYGFSTVVPAFTFDAVTNKVIAVTPSPGSLPMNFPVDGGTYDSRYDPATKTIYVSFGVNNSPTWRIIDTLTFCRSR